VYSREKLLVQQQQEGVCHTGALPFTSKKMKYLKAKEEEL
jgi:hypothetical protein